MISCIGAGPGHLDYLTRGGARRVQEAEVVAGFSTVVDLVRPLIRPDATVITMGYRDQTEKLQQVAALHQGGKTCAVVFMGDIHFSGFQFLERVEKACGHPVETFPGISSAQVMASRGRVCFDETTFVTFHRRGDLSPFRTHLTNALADGRNAIVIPRPWDFMPRDIAAFLLAQGTSAQHPVEVWENLTGEEAQWKGTLAELTGDFSDLSIMLIRNLQPFPTGLEGETF
ncbi:cobalt-precorrin-7 (C(5))-methyltransferase [Deinococcus peraridilitoris]|uniref:Precorrin-6y C5,15-methyltransferase (Decarboxylating), CbiE subunit n=1 Tax=Deinococcus peraridilitoris (strain DSM 19664 / LMG 22246 / CIP 109416 / KR-200) TaxID=937777 RepID=L0A1R8_DEIPD|nr:cobalt-precorrin-7 (C(5))-methyltransferase [Deinococcus peraridilitoris]AFZ67786.1 precorrin-6y C5,15-methyltransferase (decarboxylating), CbiE subunit [Deinococcus peraridilitoris DSM 19664]